MADLTADINLERLRSRTASVVAASTRLLEEIERSVADLEGQQAHHQSRLRPERDLPLALLAAHEAPTLGRSGVPEALKSIFQSAERVQSEVNRIREVVDRYADSLRGTDLGYDARETSALAGTFAIELLAITDDFESLPSYDVAKLRALGDGLRSAINGIGEGSLSGLGRHRGGVTPHAPDLPR